MAKMTAAEAAVRVLESEGVDLVFGQPGAAILPLSFQAQGESQTDRESARDAHRC
jgi:glyoxylate carboligase